jgi:tRNA A37 threonylcarbamoyladenosine modification protein TsaB
LLAFSAPPVPGQKIWTVIHARRDLVYLQAFTPAQNGADCPQPLTDILTLEPEQAAALIKEYGPALALGSGISRNRQTFSRLLDDSGVALPPDRFSRPSCEALHKLALFAKYGQEDIQPLYVRPSDAELQLPELSRRLGRDPDESALKLGQALGKSVTAE